MKTKYSIKFPIVGYDVKVVFKKDSIGCQIKNLVIFNDQEQLDTIASKLFASFPEVESVSFLDIHCCEHSAIIYSNE